MIHFDWQSTEDEEFETERVGWEVPRRRRRWPWLLLLLVAIVSGLVLWREAEQRTAAAEEAVTERVRTSHRLASQAAARGDEELFSNLLSGRSESWLEAQLQALEEGRLFADAAGPLGLSPHGEAEIHEIRLDPDLRQAVVVSQQAFVLTGTASVTKTVTLVQQYVYRKGGRHWLLSPPLAEFWGPVRRQKEQFVSVTYPQRDEAVARRLAEDLDALLADFCALSGVSCPPDLHLPLALATEPESIGGLVWLEQAVQAEEKMVLPAPTLVGLPVDEAGYAALLRGYAAPVLARVLAQVTAYNCCRGTLAFSALLQKQMERLGIARWPLDPAGYEMVLGQGVDAEMVRSLLLAEDSRLPLSQSGPRWRAMLAMVDFLEAEAGLERLLAQRRHLYWLWLREYGPEADAFVVSWLEFIDAHSRSGRRTIAPRPEGALQFACQSRDGGNSRLLAYDFEGEEWTELLRASLPEVEDARRGYVTVQSLPGEYGTLIREVLYQGSAWEGLLETGRIRWQPGAAATNEADAVPIYEWQQNEEEGTYEVSAGPTGRTLVLTYFGAPRYRAESVWLIDLESCLAGDCRQRPLAGVPHWSPDARQTLLVSYLEEESGDSRAQRMLYRAGPLGKNPIPLGAGFSPFWLDATVYGYLQAGVGEQTLVLAGTGDDQGLVIARTATFLEALEAAERPQTLSLESVVVLRSNPIELLVRARAGPVRQYIFMLTAGDETVTPEIRLLFSSRQRVEATPAPGGRWLVLYDWKGMTPYLFDLQEESRRVLGQGGRFIWSPSGQWLAEAHNHYFLLRRVSDEDKYLVIHPLYGCRPTGWVTTDGTTQPVHPSPYQ